MKEKKKMRKKENKKKGWEEGKGRILEREGERIKGRNEESKE